MKYTKLTFLLILTGFILINASGNSLIDSAHAQFSSRPVVTVGMSKSEVQARWGQPKLVTDKALIAESVWLYEETQKLPQQVVYFKANKLTKITGDSVLTSEPANLDLQKLRKTKTFSSAQAFMPIVSQKDLTDVLKDVPSESDAPAKTGQTSPARME